MFSLFGLFNFGKKDDSKQRASQAKAWTDAWTASPPKSADPVGTAITNNARAMQSVQSSSSSSSGGTSGGGSDGGGGTDGGSDGGTTEDTKSAEEIAAKKARKALKKSIANMKDSNIKYTNKIDLSDLWNQAASEKQNSMWTLKEEVFLYTFHDKKQHRYLNSFNIDVDKSDIMGTSQIYFPYSQKLMEYWIPGKTTFAIVGGTFDREILFIGRVGEINQRGDQIEMVGHNIGWKFKPYMTTKFEKSLETLKVKDAVKVIFKKLGFDQGRYHIDLSGIPDLDKYVLGEGLSVEHNGETVENVPELKDVVNLSEAETTQFNSKFTAFEGDKVPGTQVNALLNTMLTHNQQETEAGSKRYVKTEADFAGAINKDSKYINKKASAGKYYKVQCNYIKGLVATIIIIENK